ncbi:hypothetical protein ACHAXT_000265 [Thalassiosira profunda]
MAEGKDYYAGMQRRWASEYPSPQNIDEVWSFYKECGYDDPPATLRSMLDPVKFETKRILDYGCDNGLMIDFFSSALEGVEGHGVDINEAAIKSAREKFPSMAFAACDGLTIQFPDKHFDCVIAIATIKHVRYEDRERVYAELNRVADYALLIEADEKEKKEQSLMGWTFYNSPFAEEFESNFAEPVKVVRIAGDVLGLYKCKEVER